MKIITEIVKAIYEAQGNCTKIQNPAKEIAKGAIIRKKQNLNNLVRNSVTFLIFSSEFSGFTDFISQKNLKYNLEYKRNINLKMYHIIFYHFFLKYSPNSS